MALPYWASTNMASRSPRLPAWPPGWPSLSTIGPKIPRTQTEAPPRDRGPLSAYLRPGYGNDDLNAELARSTLDDGISRNCRSANAVPQADRALRHRRFHRP